MAHNAENIGVARLVPPNHLKHLFRQLTRNADQDHGSSEGIREPGDVGKLAILTRHRFSLVRRFEETAGTDRSPEFGVLGDAVARTTARASVEFANRRIGYDPLRSHHVYIVPPTGLPRNRVIGIQR